MYVSVHSFGAYYAWNETNNNFQYTQGEPILKSAVFKIILYFQLFINNQIWIGEKWWTRREIYTQLSTYGRDVCRHDPDALQR